MRRMSQYLAIVVIIFAVISLAIGVVFIQQGFTKEAFLVKAMQQEEITMDGVEGIIDTPNEAQTAGDTVREHRRGIAATYDELLGGERYDPTNPEHLSYAQALNLENYLYLAVVAFGLTTVTMASGVFMVITGIALGVAGLTLLMLTRITP